MNKNMKKGWYEHYKGGVYKVIGIAVHSETLKKLVLYIHQSKESEDGYWVRPFEKFTEDVEVGSKKVPRFKFLAGNFDELSEEQKKKALEAVGEDEISSKSDIAKLGEAIDKAEDEKQQIENQLKRALADYANLERDISKRVDISMTNMISRVAKKIIEVLDDADFAVKALDKMDIKGEAKAWSDGIVELIGKLQDSLNEMEVDVMEVAPGDEFDSEKHEAISTVKAGKGEKGKVIEVVQNGYLIGDSVIRCARVIVGK